jgi:excisionase family DNA binding protein
VKEEKSKSDMIATEDVAEMYAVSKRTVVRWVETLGLPAYRLGGLFRFSRKEVEEWAEQFHTRHNDSEGDNAA